MGGLAWWHWVIIIAVAVMLFGAKRLPDAARGLGRSLRILKSEVSAMHQDEPTAADGQPAVVPVVATPAVVAAPAAAPTAAVAPVAVAPAPAAAPVAPVAAPIPPVVVPAAAPAPVAVPVPAGAVNGHSA